MCLCWVGWLAGHPYHCWTAKIQQLQTRHKCTCHFFFLHWKPSIIMILQHFSAVYRNTYKKWVSHLNIFVYKSTISRCLVTLLREGQLWGSLATSPTVVLTPTFCFCFSVSTFSRHAGPNYSTLSTALHFMSNAPRECYRDACIGVR